MRRTHQGPGGRVSDTHITMMQNSGVLSTLCSAHDSAVWIKLYCSACTHKPGCSHLSPHGHQRCSWQLTDSPPRRHSTNVCVLIKKMCVCGWVSPPTQTVLLHQNAVRSQLVDYALPTFRPFGLCWVSRNEYRQMIVMNKL
jgi:hypothetical protein